MKRLIVLLAHGQVNAALLISLWGPSSKAAHDFEYGLEALRNALCEHGHRGLHLADGRRTHDPHGDFGLEVAHLHDGYRK
ncbi:hypothetical protein [Paraburkholderia sp. J10-1]|uniref:hypothetical protein n=1 Tax=Paraburkholderia sp. J10-1 TaxID=2805430 RepID=UPI002AB70A29|nr:hypothetical protein [Paraburkholderia sp. J10-1]